MEPKPPVDVFIPDDTDRIVWIALGVEETKPYFEGIESATDKVGPLVEQSILQGDIESVARAAGRLAFIHAHDARGINSGDDPLQIDQMYQYISKQKRYMTHADRKKFNKIRIDEMTVQLALLEADFVILDNEDDED